MTGAALLPGAAGVLGERFGLERIPVFWVFIALTLLILHEVLLRTRPPVQIAS
jgi:hypothetical protein